MRISTMAKTRMVLGALKQWRWEAPQEGEFPRGSEVFPMERSFLTGSEAPKGSESPRVAKLQEGAKPLEEGPKALRWRPAALS